MHGAHGIYFMSHQGGGARDIFGIYFTRAEARGIYSSLKEVDLLATLPLEVVSSFNVKKLTIINQTK